MPMFVDITLLVFLLILAVAMLWHHNLVLVVALSSMFSLVCAALFFSLDAMDVALTEAAVGAGITTLLFLATLFRVGRRERRSNHTPLVPFVVVTITGIALLYGTRDMPAFGAIDAPIHKHVAPHYIKESPVEIGPVPNVVTSILASYRGYDTLGEVLVVFTAGTAVWMLLGLGARSKNRMDHKP